MNPTLILKSRSILSGSAQPQTIVPFRSPEMGAFQVNVLAASSQVPSHSITAPTEVYVHIRYAFRSPTDTSTGGRLGLLGLPAELSNTASISILVPALAVIGSLNQYVSCHL